MYDDLVEKFAIQAAKGNNGGEWATHYTEEQKLYWRKFVVELVIDLLGVMADKLKPTH